MNQATAENAENAVTLAWLGATVPRDEMDALIRCYREMGEMIRCYREVLAADPVATDNDGSLRWPS